MVSINDLKNIFNRPKPTATKGGSNGDANGVDMEGFLASGDGSYSVDSQNWYSAKPYGFRVNFRDKQSLVMFLPISPSNLTINTNFATNIIPTLYGTIEEHSAVRYFDISIEGTTGMAPQHVSPSQLVGSNSVNTSSAYKETIKNGRETFAVANSFSAGGFFSKTLAIVNQITQKATDLVNGAPKAKTGINSENSGYAAFHNLYRVLLKYKQDASGISGSQDRDRHPLTFFNYKDNNEYDVVVKSFTMRRSADNPMLYYYSIQLRAYNLRSIGSNQTISSEYKKRLADLGLNGVDSSSALGDMKSFANSAKSILGAAAGGINILGR